MCLICIEFDKRNMTIKEARRALGEMRVGLDASPIKEVEKKLDQAETAPTRRASSANPSKKP